MRKILLLTLLAALCGIASLRADLTIVQRVDTSGMSRENTVLFKDGRARFDVSPRASMIWNLKSGELIKLIHAQKGYIKIPSDGASKEDAMAVAPTGKKDTISGFPADEYTCTLAGVKATVWLTKAAPDYAGLVKEMSAFYGMDIAALPGFPVRIIYELHPGEITTTTVLSMDAKPIADSVFDIPADYKQMTLPLPTQAPDGENAGGQ